MKFLLTVLLLGFFKICLSQSSAEMIYTHKATYELTWQPDSTDAKSVQSERMLLYLGDGFSKFSSFGKHIKDSLFSSYKQNKNSTSFSEYRAKVPEMHFKYVLYQNLPEGKLTFTKRIGTDKILYRENQHMDWEIQEEQDEILGYRVQKAKTSYKGRNYTAWFSEDLPFSTGPYKFNGLPGLIIKIRDANNHYIYTLIGFKKLDKPINHNSTLLDEFLKTDRENFNQIQADYDKDPFGTLERAGMRFPGMSTQEKNRRTQEYRQNKKEENNPIELE